MLDGIIEILYFRIHKKRFDYNIDTNKILLVVKELINNYITFEFNQNLTFIANNNAVVSIVNINNNNVNMQEKTLKIIDRLKLENELIYFTVVYSEISSDISKIKNIYEDMQKSLKFRRLRNETQLLDAKSINTISKKYNFSITAQDKIKNYVKNDKFDECKTLVDSLIDDNVKDDASSFSIQLLCIDIFNICKHVLDETCNAVPTEFNTTKYYDIFEKCTYSDEYKKHIHNILEFSISNINAHASDNYVINYVKTYLNENYKTDISYNTIAENLNITRPYLTTYFKSKTGMNPSEYLNRQRINKSIYLLSNTSLKIKDISKDVGIYNVSTFIRIFKKYMGKTPNEYKRMAHS